VVATYSLPDLRTSPPGCSFGPRCRFAMPACIAGSPPSHDVGSGHAASCLRIDAVRRAAPDHAVA